LIASPFEGRVRVVQLKLDDDARGAQGEVAVLREDAAPREAAEHEARRVAREASSQEVAGQVTVGGTRTPALGHGRESLLGRPKGREQLARPAIGFDVVHEHAAHKDAASAEQGDGRGGRWAQSVQAVVVDPERQGNGGWIEPALLIC
jgi:hypothetical protein